MPSFPTRLLVPMLVIALVGLFLIAPTVRAADLVVSTTNSSGPGSLAQAIADANTNPGADTIRFAILTPPLPEGYWVIANPSLPPLSGGDTTIDGASQPGGRADGGPKIALVGPDNGSSGPPGISITSANNVVSGLIINTFGGAGILINGSTATGNQIYGNYIGTNWDGTVAARNFLSGITIANGASNNTVGGLGPGQRNVVSGNGSADNRAQIVVESDLPLTADKEMRGNQIVGNYVGTTASGTSALPGASHGVLLGNNSLTTTVGPGNVIAGNAPANAQLPTFGIAIDGSYSGSIPPANVIKGNTIGLNAPGSAALPNGSTRSDVGGGGINIKQVGQQFVGGSTPADRNVIGGHVGPNMYGILIDIPCPGDLAPTTTVAGNYVGLNGAGSPLPNTQGIRIAPFTRNTSKEAQIAPCNVQIGPGNVIAGNSSDGIRLIGVLDASDERQARNNRIVGNLIGTTPAGDGSLPNGGSGIYITRGAHHNTIGGTLAEGNVIAGNTQVGILIETFGGDVATAQNQPDNNTISGNAIGTDSGGTARIGNGTHGILIRTGASNNTVGPDNRVNYNQADGIQLSGGTANRITRTTTAGNGGLGIRLVPPANGGMQPPVGIKLQGTTLSGQVQGFANSTVEIFSSAQTEVGEGNMFVATVTTDGAGRFSTSVPVGDPAAIFSLTATDSLGNSSQFSGTSARVLLPVVRK